MHKGLLGFLLSFCLFSFSIHAKEEHPRDFFMLSIPKSGTHLLVKLLVMLTEKERIPIGKLLTSYPSNLSKTQLEAAMLQAKQKNLFAYGHTFPEGNAPLLLEFVQEHREYVPILQVRDLRDTIVSYIYYKKEEIRQEMGGSPSYGKMLTYILSIQNSKISQIIKRNVEYAISIYQQPHVHVMRFEEIVGKDGGGSLQQQQAAILQLAEVLGISLPAKRLHVITENLFGIENGPPIKGTFRQGQIGSWKRHFNSKHIRLFEQNWGTYQKALGYR